MAVVSGVDAPKPEARRSAWRAAAAYDRAPTALHRGALCGVIAYP